MTNAPLLTIHWHLRDFVCTICVIAFLIGSMTAPALTVGKVYEIEPLITYNVNGILKTHTSVGRLVGFISKGEPVFEDDGQRFSATPTGAIITPIKDTP